MKLLHAHLCCLAMVVSAPVPAQRLVPAARTPAPAATLAYADVADLVLASPVIADALVRSAVRIKPAEAIGAAPGTTRYYVEADLQTLVRGVGGLPPRIGYLVDLRPDAAGRLPKLKKMRVLLFARAAQAGSNQLQLVAPDAQQPWSPTLEAQVRAVAAAAVAADTPPRITGVGSAFHVPGALPGESETQIFLATAGGRPVSLSVLRRPNEPPRWAVALSEIVDEAAAPPPRDTLLWYRLACGLPRSLPDRSLAELDEAGAAATREDYAFVLSQLGPCRRIRGTS